MPKILVALIEQEIGQLVSQHLEEKGIEVLLTTNFEQAKALLKLHKVSGCVLDGYIAVDCGFQKVRALWADCPPTVLEPGGVLDVPIRFAPRDSDSSLCDLHSHS